MDDKDTLAKAIPYDRFVPAEVGRPHQREFPGELAGGPAPPGQSAA